jgi:5'-nucleotidase
MTARRAPPAACPKTFRMRVLLTNDDGITATGLNAMRRALLELPDVDLEVIAPDSNRSATGRAVTLRDPLWVEEVEFGDGTSGFATDGTPVDCVRFATLGLIEEPPELIVSGINHGHNLGDDITYSGTVAAALEGIVLGVPAIAVSLAGRNHDFEPLARFVARVVDELDDVPMPAGTLLNVNGPPGDPKGACACRLGKRVYNDKLELIEEGDGGRRRYHLYGDEPSYEHEPGTDFAAIDDGLIAVTPIHFDLTDEAGVAELAGFDLERLLRPATEAVE